ncbi:Co2+/Mg2+ efflux protein ApaG [Gammaproteobacteria bacterium]|nr:Co2+/Mg2+ efflux protein ApaG [Gammaproteobacteria bacterium]|tara:strand:- start:1590 stop:1970 length:381 start_codon:yes stop_codon:yes gene_type:complete
MNTLAPSIAVAVVSEYLDRQSSPENNRFAFAYHITINNQGSSAATLLTRHWIIVDANQERQEVHGAGVIGQTPTIQPGSCYEYTSAVVLDTPIGTMEGSYQLVDAHGTAFDAPIAPFLLSMPNKVH